MTKNVIKDITISILIFVAVLYGLPKVLSLVFNTPYPVAAISSNSMLPVLEKGDLILVKGVEKEDIRIGDIIIYREDEGFIIHRVTKLQDKTLITKGDANTNSDAPVEYERIVGRTFNISEKPFVVPYLGSITAFANPEKK